MIFLLIELGHPLIEKFSIQNPRVNDIFAECPWRQFGSGDPIELFVEDHDDSIPFDATGVCFVLCILM
jgi:hypothetical protein